MIEAFAKALIALPVGTFTGHVGARKYVISKTEFNNGASVKLVAEELGGPDYISLNFYDLRSGARLKPCEMPASKVIAFVVGLVPET